MEQNKGFIACHNLGRIAAIQRYTEITQKETDLAAPDRSGLTRYIVEVVHRCEKSATDEQKQRLFDQYKAGEWIPEISDIITEFQYWILNESK